MRFTSRHTRGRIIAALIGTVVLSTGCANSAEDEGNASAAEPATPTGTSSPTATDEPFGAGCAGLPASGPGSLSAISTQPVATAAADIPALSTLVTAVTKAGLVDTLNKAPAVTVFAPTNEAFAKIPKATLDKVLADKATLTKILTYHVVGSRIAPSELDGGSLTTLQGGKLTTAKAGETFTVNDAQVLCGNIQTDNGTVYVIDSVLMPPA